MPACVLSARPLPAAALGSLALTATTSAVLFFVTLHLQQVRGWSPLATGLGFLPVLVAVVVASTLAPRLIARVSERAALVAGLALIGAGALVLAGISARGGYTGAILPGGVLYGGGLGIGSVAANAAGTAALPDARQGLASGLLNTAAQIGTALGLAVLVTIASARTAQLGSGADSLVVGFRWAFVANAALAVIAAAVVGSRACCALEAGSGQQV